MKSVLPLILAASFALAAPQVSYTRLLEHVRAGEVASAVITPQKSAAPVQFRLRDGRTLDSTLPADYSQALALMQQRNVDVGIAAPSPSLLNAVPFLLLLAVWLGLLLMGNRFKNIPRLF